MENTDIKPTKKPTFAHYWTGYVLSVLLTIAAYTLVTRHSLGTRMLMIGVVVLALVQFVVQLVFFLHLGIDSKPRWKLFTLLFMLMVVSILVFGSLWIMDNLNYRMTPQQVNTYMHDQGAIKLFKAYYQLTKPGIIYGNLLTTAAGFFLASTGHIAFGRLIATVIGVALVIGSACVFNNYIDRDIDKHMARTKQRALVQRSISARNALIYATVLGVIGFVILGGFVNILTVAIGVVGFLDYVVAYGIGKRNSVHGTLVGSIAGAAPIVAGYAAVTDHLGVEALLLFLILAFWQMPHFYSIAMYRFDDYKKAGLPVLPVKKGFQATKIQIVSYVAAFIAANALLTILGYTGYVYLVIMLAIGLYWLGLGVKGFTIKNDKTWARKMFFFSLIVILVTSTALAVGARLA